MKKCLRLMSVLLDFSSLPCKLINLIFFLCDSAPMQFKYLLMLYEMIGNIIVKLPESSSLS